MKKTKNAIKTFNRLVQKKILRQISPNLVERKCSCGEFILHRGKFALQSAMASYKNNNICRYCSLPENQKQNILQDEKINKQILDNCKYVKCDHCNSMRCFENDKVKTNNCLLSKTCNPCSLKLKKINTAAASASVFTKKCKQCNCDVYYTTELSYELSNNEPLCYICNNENNKHSRKHKGKMNSDGFYYNYVSYERCCGSCGAIIVCHCKAKFLSSIKEKPIDKCKACRAQLLPPIPTEKLAEKLSKKEELKVFVDSGILIQGSNGCWNRKCKGCNKILTYTGSLSFYTAAAAVRRDSLCNSCKKNYKKS